MASGCKDTENGRMNGKIAFWSVTVAVAGFLFGAFIAKIKIYVTAIFQFFKAFYLLLFKFKVILVAFAF